jgi:membrane protein implicated in regulation of membrane protease activity
MVDKTGTAISSILPGGVGRVQTHGEIWTARSDVPIHEGDPVRVAAVTGLLLTVVPDPDAARISSRSS